VTLSLRSSVPGRLDLQGSLERLLVQQLRFPEGEQRRLPFTTEGTATLALPVEEIADKQVALLRVFLRAPSTGSARVIPPVGPEPSKEAIVLLDPERGVLVELPPGRLETLTTLEAIRVPLVAGPVGAELRGVLRAADAAGAAAEPLPDGQLGPVSVPAGALGGLRPPTPGAADVATLPEPTWVTLALARPQQLPAGARRWVELFASRGLAGWPLAVPPGEGTAAGFAAAVRRTTPDGGQRPLSSLHDLDTSGGVIRLVGTAPEDRPIPILDVGVAGSALPVVTSLASLRDGILVELALPTTMAAVDADGRPLALSFTAFAPIDLVVGPISVGYL
jgi:hypothetical protein